MQSMILYSTQVQTDPIQDENRIEAGYAVQGGARNSSVLSLKILG